MEQEEVPKESVPSDLKLEASNNQKPVSTPNNCIFFMVLHTSDVHAMHKKRSSLNHMKMMRKIFGKKNYPNANESINY
ncbi:hypothetical protein BpHYR1_044911 [Brachionus plicatilis]|uniref:Uncharacterized protein n=1 Tax=Brachionus plicatilis TaxID=10195 RepID=A0A3M7QWG2_BRAPC|nr:hypothetical protein BpHYR1_044911 [Brachionus plicatilis]